MTCTWYGEMPPVQLSSKLVPSKVALSTIGGAGKTTKFIVAVVNNADGSATRTTKALVAVSGDAQPGWATDFGKGDGITVWIAGAPGQCSRIRLPGVGGRGRERIADECWRTVGYSLIMRRDLVGVQRISVNRNFLHQTDELIVVGGSHAGWP